MPKDKQAHFAIGVAVAVYLTFLAGVWGWVGPGLALALGTTGAGFAIEAYQWVRGEGKVEFLDFVATAAPGWAIWAILTLVP